MLCQYFLDDIRKINYNVSINDGNTVSRFSFVALKILMLSDRVLSMDLQVKLNSMKNVIKENLYLYEYAGTLVFKVLNMKKATAKRYLQYLQEFEDYAIVLYKDAHQYLLIKSILMPDNKPLPPCTTSEKAYLDFCSRSKIHTDKCS